MNFDWVPSQYIQLKTRVMRQSTAPARPRLNREIESSARMMSLGVDNSAHMYDAAFIMALTSWQEGKWQRSASPLPHEVNSEKLTVRLITTQYSGDTDVILL
jgi:hypothetical protein